MKAGISLSIMAICLSLCSTGAFAQNAKLAQANRAFSRLNYQEAIELYQAILKKQQVPEALFNLAECYRKVGDPKNAEIWYSQAVLHPEATPEMYFYLGQALLANDKLGAARVQFEKFIELAPDQRRGQNLRRACSDTLRRELMNGAALYTVKNLEEVNSRYDDFGASIFRKGLVFCSERDTLGAAHRRSAWTGRSFVGTYYCDRRLTDEDKLEYKYGKSELFQKPFNSRVHDGPIAFANFYQEAYVTRNSLRGKSGVLRGKNGIVTLGIYRTTAAGEKWGALQPVGINNPDFTVAHAALNADGDKMYFSSDMEGGFGGMDLYVSYAEGNGRWSEPINLGPEINTEGDEIFPFVSANGTLYFASDGHAGLGGLDIFYSRAQRGKWEPVQNVGFPINSNYDDFAYVTDSAGRVGYFSSNREGGMGMTDIYSFTRLTIETQILVYDRGSGKGIEGAVLTTECFPKQTYTTNVDGKVYVELPLNKGCKFKVESEYGNTEVDVSTAKYQVRTTLFFDAPIDVTQQTFATNGVVRDKKGKPIENAEVTLLSSCGKTQTAKTNFSGDYRFELDPNCCYMVRVSKDGFFTSVDTFCTKGKTKSQVFESNVTMPRFWEENMLADLDTTSIYAIDNIYYQTGSFQIDIKRSPGLQTLLGLLRSNPGIAVEIRSHTDSRGTEEDNQMLSIKRAQAVVDYLTQNGIPEDRLRYKGFGESQLVNHCTDDVPCSDADHKPNRRTEFRVFQIKNN